MCTYAHGEAELRIVHDDNVPEHVKRIRARQEETASASEPGNLKRARGSEDEDTVDKEEEEKPPSLAGPLEATAVPASAAAAGAAVPTAKAFLAPTAKPLLRSKAKPRRPSALPVAGTEPEKEEETGLPTRICNLGFSEPACVYLGAKEHAFSIDWLESHAIRNLVKCMPGRYVELSPGTHVDEHLVLGLEPNDLNDIDSYFATIRLHFEILKVSRGNMFFYCPDGRRRSAALLSMYLLFIFPGESPDKVMAKIKRAVPEVEFLDSPDKFPMAKVVRLWGEWLLTGSVPREAKAWLQGWAK